MEYSILILITPLFLFLFLGLVGGKLRPNIAGIIGTLGMGFCAVLAYSVAYQYFFVIGKTADCVLLNFYTLIWAYCSTPSR